MAKLTIQDVAKILTEKSGLTQKQANKFASEMFALIIEKLQEEEQVKVRGLGTFKVITVEPRESVNVRTGERILIEGHDKVTFTPDTLIKELVNKPFSQFETVVLNEGVVFEDETDGNKEEGQSEEEEGQSVEEDVDLPLEERPLVTYVDEETVEPENEDTPETSNSPENTDTPQILEIVESEVTEEQPDSQSEDEEQQEEQESSTEEEWIDEEEENGTPWLKWIFGAVGVLVLMLASAYAGYRYAMNEVEPVLERLEATTLEKEKKVAEEKVDTPIAVKDSMVVSEPMVASKPLEAAKPVEQVEPVKGVKPIEMIKSAAQAKQKDEKNVQPKVEESLDPYAAKDERVRLGAYRIVGTLHVITVQPGQTFYSICKGNLGPDMECYVEVYNDFPRRPQIKVGQKIKIPKLELKKKRKR